MKRKAVAIVCSSALAVAGMFVFTGANAPTKAAVTPTEEFNGYSTGTDVYADALRLPGPNPTTELANVNVGFSRSAADSTGLKTIDNEMSNAVVPQNLQSLKPTGSTPAVTTSNNTYGGGSGLELGLGTSLPNNPDLNQLILAGLAEQVAPCAPAGPLCVNGRMPAGSGPNGAVVKEIAIPADPLVFASLLRGRAYANFDSTDPCAINDPNNQGGLFDTGLSHDLSYGQGDTAHVELLNTGGQAGPGIPALGDPGSKPVLSTTGNQPPDRFVGTARSFTRLVPNGDGTFALVSETHETVAPITLFKNTPNQVTIEVLGEAILTAKATGSTGGATVTYTPPSLIRIFPPAPAPPQDVIPPPTTFGIPPIVIPGQPGQPNLLEIFIGEKERAPDQAVPGNSHADASHVVGPIEQADGTQAWGAVDVVRLRLLVPDPTSHLAEVRVEHMESKAQVPTAGVFCPTTNTTASTTPGTPTTTPGTPTTATTTPGTPTTNTTATTTPPT